MNIDHLRAVGVVLGVHGLQGTLKIEPLTDFPERFEAIKSLFFTRGDTVILESRIKRMKWANQHLLLTVKDISKREDAERMVGTEICVPLDDSWELPKDTYYISDIVGYKVFGDDGTELGMLNRVHHTTQHLLEIHGTFGELLVPFVKEWVGVIDQAKQTIEILSWKRLIHQESVNPDQSENDY